MNDTLIILLTLILSAFFSGMEIAFVSANRLMLELDKKSNTFNARIIKRLAHNDSQYIATMLIGNNIALVVYGIIMAKILEPGIRVYFSHDSIVILIQTVLSTFLILILAEFLPKALFRINPNQTLKVFALPIYVFYLLLYPVAMFTMHLSKVVIRIFFRVKIDDKSKISFGKTDLDNLVSESKGDDNEDEDVINDVRIFQNALDFSNIKLRECVVPRTELTAISVDEPVENLKQKFIVTGHSKVLVYEDTIDNIIGYAHLIELFQKPSSIKSMIRKLPIVPQTMPANKLLAMFLLQRKSMALVVDEFGGTSGVVTMEDIIEEIIGDIQDEHDKQTLHEEKINDHEYRFAARHEIDDINEKYNLDLPVSDDYETLAGLLLSEYGSIPKTGDIIKFDSFIFKVLKATDTKIEMVHLTIRDED